MQEVAHFQEFTGQRLDALVVDVQRGFFYEFIAGAIFVVGFFAFILFAEPGQVDAHPEFIDDVGGAGQFDNDVLPSQTTIGVHRDDFFADCMVRGLFSLALKKAVTRFTRQIFNIQF
jgi:hypothetical protein